MIRLKWVDQTGICGVKNNNNKMCSVSLVRLFLLITFTTFIKLIHSFHCHFLNIKILNPILTGTQKWPIPITFFE